jgi:hypothetical protein
MLWLLFLSFGSMIFFGSFFAAWQRSLIFEPVIWSPGSVRSPHSLLVLSAPAHMIFVAAG